MDDSICPSTTPARSRTIGNVSPTTPVIARKLRYDSAGFSPPAAWRFFVSFWDNIVLHVLLGSTEIPC
jgi:hypothetical protein